MHEISEYLPTESDMLALGAKLAKGVERGAVIFLYGELGTGKTTFTRGFLSGLGLTGKVKSPTYAMVEPYEIAGRWVFHFDLYRVNDPIELEHMGIREYFSPSSICLIEWPEKGLKILPVPDLSCHFSFTNQGRAIRFEAHSARGEKIMSEMMP